MDAAIEMAELRATVNCAGIGPPQRTDCPRRYAATIWASSRPSSDQLIGTFNTIRIAASAMAHNDPHQHNERGAIVNTVSVAAYDGQIG